MDYKIYGDYGYTGETLLAEFETLQAAVDWLLKYEADTFGGLGGFSVVEIATFTHSGEYVTHETLRAEDYLDNGDDDDPMDDFNYHGHPAHY